MDIHSYHCEGLVWEQYWMEFTPTSMMDIPVGQQSVIYNGEIYNQELTKVAELITSPEAIKNNLAVAFLTKIIYQWICLMYADGKKDPQRRQIEKLIATLHASLQQRWSVADMAATIPCSEAWLRRLFLTLYRQDAERILPRCASGSGAIAIKATRKLGWRSR